MASGRDSGPGCGCILAFIIAVAIFCGIRSCVVSIITGEKKLPSFGSSKVSGGSGGHGTSNGYNVKYKNTTSPNYNSSQNDYSHTDQYQTEFENGRLQKKAPKGSLSEAIEKYEKEKKSGKEIKKCPDCEGSGISIYKFRPSDGMGNSCLICGDKDSHLHPMGECKTCNGTGRLN